MISLSTPTPTPTSVKPEPKPKPRQFFTCTDCCTRYSVSDLTLVSQCDLCEEYICSSCYREKDGIILSCIYCLHHHALCASCDDILPLIGNEYADWHGPVCSSCSEPLCDTCSKGFGLCITCFQEKFDFYDEESERKVMYHDEYLNELSLPEVGQEDGSSPLNANYDTLSHYTPLSDTEQAVLRNPIIQDVVKVFSARVTDTRSKQPSYKENQS